MRQRVMIAIAFACDPKILICDEPTTALDVTIQGQILDIIKNLQKKNQTSVIMITHDLGVVANIAQKIAVMYSGIIVESGTCEDIFYRPRHPYTWALIRSVPRLDLKNKQELATIPGTPPDLLNLSLIHIFPEWRERTSCPPHQRSDQYAPRASGTEDLSLIHI